jgi:hypothetical protein
VGKHQLRELRRSDSGSGKVIGLLVDKFSQQPRQVRRMRGTGLNMY